MNEMKAGERPDTIYLQNLPTKWFLDPYDRSGALKDKPSEYVLKKVFQTFGEIRALDIPSLDPYRYTFQDWQVSFLLIFIPLQKPNEIQHCRNPDLHFWSRSSL